MSADYQPGTVAIATVRGVKGVRVFSVDGRWVHDEVDEKPGGPVRVSSSLDEVTDVRPLVVLDLNEAAPTEAHDSNFPEWLRTAANVDEKASSQTNRRPEFLRALANQIEAQTRPPRIPEPGLWGVVEAHTGVRDRSDFIRARDGWFAVDVTDLPRHWDDLIDPTLIREGLS